MLPILYQDQHLIAVHKPARLLVHRSAVDAHERRFALQVVREQIGQRVYAVHRLDKGTSGVLLFALSREVGSAVSTLFATRQVHKTYIAIVRGEVPEHGEIDRPLHRLVDAVDASADFTDAAPGEQDASTRFRRLATVELPHRVDRYPSARYSLLEIEPLSGRQHQIRRHMKHISHPIIGDTTYGKGRHNRLFQTLFGSDRMLLACVELRLPHPLGGAPLQITAPLAADFASVIEQLSWTANVPLGWRADLLDG